MRYMTVLLSLCFSCSSFAAAYKCTDASGKTTYQAKPCQEQKDAVEIDLKTGTVITHEMELKLKEMQLKKEQEDLEKMEQLQKLVDDTRIQSDLNQAYIKKHWTYFSAFAIPPYTIENFPEIAQNYRYRLPEIEHYRRLASVIALNGGKCGRVEASELSNKSIAENLVFTIDCRTGIQIEVTEANIKTKYPEITNAQ